MGNEFRQCPEGVLFENEHVQQILLSWMGMGGRGVPLRQTSVQDDALYAVDARNAGAGGLHYRATHSSGSPVLFDVTDAGMLASVGGEAASNPFIYPSMVVGWAAPLAFIPVGWTVVAASQGRFPYGASVDGDLGATGGSATYDVSHTHTGPSHSHSANTGSGGTADTGFGGGANTGSGGAATTDNTSVTTNLGGAASTNNTNVTTNLGGAATTDNDGSFSGNTGGGGGFTTSTPVSGLRSVTDDGAPQVDVADKDHEHSESNHDHSITIGTHDHAITQHQHVGPSHDHVISQHQHVGPSHDHVIQSHVHSGPTHQHSGPSHNHSISADGTGATGSGGSATQSTLPPYFRMFFIERD